MSYDPLLTYMSEENYLYVSFYYPTRESYVPQLKTQAGDESQNHITANLPRIVCDMPYLRLKTAKSLDFSH